MGIPQEQYEAMLSRLEKSKHREPPAVPDDAAELEIPLQEQCVKDALSRGWWVLWSRTDLPTTTPLGSPDLVVFRDGGRVVIVEAKSKTGKLRPAQLGVKAKLESLGHTVHVIRAYSEWLAAINS